MIFIALRRRYFDFLSNKPRRIDFIKTKFLKHFKMKDFGAPSSCIGIAVNRDEIKDV